MRAVVVAAPKYHPDDVVVAEYNIPYSRIGKGTKGVVVAVKGSPSGSSAYTDERKRTVLVRWDGWSEATPAPVNHIRKIPHLGASSGPADVRSVLYSELRREGFSHSEAMLHAGLGTTRRTAAAGPKAIASGLLEVLEGGDTEMFWRQLATALGSARGMDCLSQDMWGMLKAASDEKDEFTAQQLLEDVRNRYPDGTYEQFWAPGGSPQHDALMAVWKAEREEYAKMRNASRRRALTDEEYELLREDYERVKGESARYLQEFGEGAKEREEARQRANRRMREWLEEHRRFQRGGGEPYA